MALLVLLFLDLATIPTPQQQGDDGLYRQAMTDHHLKGQYWLVGHHLECDEKLAGNFPDALVRSYDRANSRPSWMPIRNAHVQFSYVGWLGDQALFQLTTDDAYSCLLYRRVGRSYRMVRELRFRRPG